MYMGHRLWDLGSLIRVPPKASLQGLWAPLKGVRRLLNGAPLKPLNSRDPCLQVNDLQGTHTAVLTGTPAVYSKYWPIEPCFDVLVQNLTCIWGPSAY